MGILDVGGHKVIRKKYWHMQGLFQKKCMYDDEMIRFRFISALSNSSLWNSSGQRSDGIRVALWVRAFGGLLLA